MQYLLFLLSFIMEVSILILLTVVIYMLKDIKNKIKTKKQTQSKRVHKAIKKSDYDNAFGGRNTGYELYKNENGLYEPQKPSKGIELKKKEE